MRACFVVITVRHKGDGKCFKLEGEWLEEESGIGMGCAHTHHIDLCIAPQVTQLQAYKDKRSELADAEQFVVVVSVVVV